MAKERHHQLQSEDSGRGILAVSSDTNHVIGITWPVSLCPVSFDHVISFHDVTNFASIGVEWTRNLGEDKFKIGGQRLVDKIGFNADIYIYKIFIKRS